MLIVTYTNPLSTSGQPRKSLNETAALRLDPLNIQYLLLHEIVWNNARQLLVTYTVRIWSSFIRYKINIGMIFFWYFKIDLWDELLTTHCILLKSHEKCLSVMTFAFYPVLHLQSQSITRKTLVNKVQQFLLEIQTYRDLSTWCFYDDVNNPNNANK